MGVDRTERTTDMARISLYPPRTLVYRMTEWYSRRRWGTVAEPAAAMAHNTRVLVADARFEMAVDKFRKLDPTLRALAEMRSAASIGCSWCMDFGYWVAHEKGVDPAKLRAVPQWRDSDVYSDLERRVLEYAEAATATPPTVTDELVESLRRDLGNAALVELTMMIAVENLRSRFNSSLGLTSQGFKDRCELPATPLRPAGTTAA
jgi:alkylhydroperoxidase family enzyme